MSMKWKENELTPYGILKAWTTINIMSTIINSTQKYKFSPTYMNTCAECRWLMFLILWLLLISSLIYNSWHGLKECTLLISRILSISQFMSNLYSSATHKCVRTSDIHLSNFDSMFLCKLKISKWNHYRIIIPFVIQWLLMHQFSMT